MAEWDDPVGDVEEITGFQLQVTNVKNGSTVLVYDGKRNPSTKLFYVENGLLTGEQYEL